LFGDVVLLISLINDTFDYLYLNTAVVFSCSFFFLNSIIFLTMKYDIINIIIIIINTNNKINEINQTACYLQYVPLSFGLCQNEHFEQLLFSSDLQFGISK